MAQDAQTVPQQPTVPTVAGETRLAHTLIELSKDIADRIFCFVFAPSVSIVELTSHEACKETGNVGWVAKMARTVKSNGDPTRITDLERL